MIARRQVMALAPGVVALAGAVMVFAGLLLLEGRSPWATLSGVVREGFLSPLGVQNALVKAIPVLWCSLAVALPARAGLLNLGGEGQFLAGAMGATGVVLTFPGLGRPTLLLLMAAAAVCAGALWALIPALLRLKLGASEVLTSLMLNYVAALLLEHLVHGPWKDPGALGWPYSRMFPETAVLPHYGSTNIHAGLIVALIATAVLAFGAARTVWGYETRLLGSNAILARRSGVSVARHFLAAMLIAGAMAGLGGLGEASVVQQRLRSGLSSGFGYVGFLAAFLAGNRFWLLPFVALALGGLYAGADGLQITQGLPGSVIDVFLGLVFLGVLGARSAFHRFREA